MRSGSRSTCSASACSAGPPIALNLALFFPLGASPSRPLVTRLALLVSAAVFVVGVILFGVAMLRGRGLPRVPVWLYLLGFPPFAVAARLPDTPLTSALHVLVGVALAWLAVALWSKGSTWNEAAVVATGATGPARVRVSARATNLTLLVALILVFATGVGAVATGSARGRWIVIAHGVVAIVVILLIPWKSIVIRRGLRRGRPNRWASLVLAGLVLTTLVAGLASVTGLVRSVGGFGILWLHIAGALVLVPLLLWHLVTRPVRLLAAAGADRRPARRRGWIGARLCGSGRSPPGRVRSYAVSEATLRVAGAPGARRRFTGSHPIDSADPDAMPVTSWLDDRTPTIDASEWRLAVVDGAGRRELALE